MLATGGLNNYQETFRKFEKQNNITSTAPQRKQQRCRNTNT